MCIYIYMLFMYKDIHMTCDKKNEGDRTVDFDSPKVLSKNSNVFV